MRGHNQCVTIANKSKFVECEKKPYMDLKQIREGKGITLEEIFVATRISATNLEAIEKGHYHILPSAFIGRAFIRAYAQQIGIAPDDILADYETFLTKLNNTLQNEQPTNEEMFLNPYIRQALEFAKTNQKKLVRITTYAIVATVLVALAISLPVSQMLTTSPEKQDGKTIDVGGLIILPTATNSSTVKQNTTQTYHLIIEATDTSWIKVAKDGNPAIDFVLSRGQKFEDKASEVFAIEIGNAGGVRVIFQGKNLGTLGEKHQVIRLVLPDKQPRSAIGNMSTKNTTVSTHHKTTNNTTTRAVRQRNNKPTTHHPTKNVVSNSSQATKPTPSTTNLVNKTTSTTVPHRRSNVTANNANAKTKIATPAVKDLP